jgi:signal transduction histidine kinase
MEGIRSLLRTQCRFVMHRSLTRRVLLVQIVACALMLATLSVMLWQMAARSGKADAERSVKQFAHVFAHLEDPARTAQPLVTVLLGLADARSHKLKPVDDRVRYEIRDAHGGLLAGTTPSPRAASGGWTVGEIRDPETGRTVIVSLRESIATDLWREDIADLMSRIAIVMLMLIIPILLGGTVMLIHFSLAPVNELGRTIATRSSDNLAPITTPRRYVELAPVLDELNRLLERLRDAQAVERRFFADAAHELLTPIAALRAQTHLLATAPDESAKAAAKFDVESGLQRVSSMIRQLLTLAQISSAELRLDLRPQDLVPLVQERLAAAAARAWDKRIEMDLQAPRACPCVFDAGAMASVLDNVIDNAIRYVQPEGRIRVQLHQHAQSVSISVADNGPGIAAEYRDKVFERFFRVPGNTETGSGLGLAIVARIVALHQGTVALLNGLGPRGLLVCIRLPALQLS